MENQFSCKIKNFQSDGGAEFFSSCFHSHLRNTGIHHQMSRPYTSYQDGYVECKHCHVTEIGLALLFHHMFPLHTTPLSTGCLHLFLAKFLPLKSCIVRSIII
jgi:hypothetical protein